MENPISKEELVNNIQAYYSHINCNGLADEIKEIFSKNKGTHIVFDNTLQSTVINHTIDNSNSTYILKGFYLLPYTFWIAKTAPMSETFS